MSKKTNLRGLVSLVLLVSLLSVLLVGCGGEPDPHCGVWKADTFSMSGITATVEEVYGDEELSFELEDGGKGTMTMEGEVYKIKWSIEDGVLTLGDSSMTLSGEISDTEVTIEDFGDEEGLNFHFVKQ